MFGLTHFVVFAVVVGVFIILFCYSPSSIWFCEATLTRCDNTIYPWYYRLIQYQVLHRNTK